MLRILCNQSWCASNVLEMWFFFLIFWNLPGMLLSKDSFSDMHKQCKWLEIRWDFFLRVCEWELNSAIYGEVILRTRNSTEMGCVGSQWTVWLLLCVCLPFLILLGFVEVVDETGTTLGMGTSHSSTCWRCTHGWGLPEKGSRRKTQKHSEKLCWDNFPVSPFHSPRDFKTVFIPSSLKPFITNTSMNFLAVG